KLELEHSVKNIIMHIDGCHGDATPIRSNHQLLHSSFNSLRERQIPPARAATPSHNHKIPRSISHHGCGVIDESCSHNLSQLAGAIGLRAIGAPKLDDPVLR